MAVDLILDISVTFFVVLRLWQHHVRVTVLAGEVCCPRCVQNSGGFIIWRAAFLRTSAPPQTTCQSATAAARRLAENCISQRHLRIYCVFNNKKIDKISSSAIRHSFQRTALCRARLVGGLLKDLGPGFGPEIRVRSG